MIGNAYVTAPHVPCLGMTKSARHVVSQGRHAADAVARLKTRDGERLNSRIGIATGIVVVGDLVGQGSAQEQAVVGDTSNLAARLQASPSPAASSLPIRPVVFLAILSS